MVRAVGLLSTQRGLIYERLNGLCPDHAPFGDGTLGWQPARVETGLDTANTSACPPSYSFTCTACTGSKPLKCVGEALL